MVHGPHRSALKTLAASTVLVALIAGACGSPEPAITPPELVAGTPAALTQLPSATLAARGRHIAALLPDGRVLLAGGNGPSGTILSSAQIYDPGTNAPAVPAPPSLAYGRYDATATRLLTAQDEILVVGGSGAAGTVSQSERFHPGTGNWSSAAPLTPSRYQHTATLLPSGSVLVIGGQDNSSTLLDLVSLYDPASNTWSPLQQIPLPRARHAATSLPNGDILVAGGYVGVGSGSTADVRIFDVASSTWISAAPMSHVRNQHTITLLADGDVLAVGYDDHVERYDRASDTWTAVAPLGAYPDRYRHTTTALPNGCVLVVGGQVGPSGGGTYIADVELYDPDANTWTSSLPLAVPRTRHSATLLAGGVVLVVGGETSGPTLVTTAERYALRADGVSCTTRCDCLNGFCVDGVCCDSACDGDCGTCLAAQGAPADGICTPTGAVTCDDGDLCTQSDTCSNGVCAGVLTTCLLPGPCQGPGQCNPASGQCGYPSLPNGTDCDDGQSCTENDACQAGSCQGAAVVCPAPGVCRLPGVCNPSTGACDYAVAGDGTGCDDGDLCTEGDACQSGICVGGAPVICPPPAPCYQQAVCEQATGACPAVPMQDGAPCDDSDACTRADTCEAGACQSGAPVVCSPPGPCEEPGSCEPVGGQCVYAPRPSGTLCEGGVCNAGICVPDADQGARPDGIATGAFQPPATEDVGGCACRAVGATGATRPLLLPSGLAFVIASLARLRARTARSNRSSRLARPR